MKKKVIVLGAGIAGLTLSIELLLKGYKVTLIEKNDNPGGLCSGYFVNGHYIDACLHWLMGTKKDSQLYNYWKEIGAFSKDQKFISLPTLGSFEYEGTTITFYRDIEKTRKELVEISPEDESMINKFVDSVIAMANLMAKSQKYDSETESEYKAKLKKIPHVLKSTRMSREDYSLKFKHPAIRFAMKNCQTGYNNMFFFFDLYGIFINGNADVPVGGAYYMVDRIKNRFLELGGELLTNTEVLSIETRDNEVQLIRTNKGNYIADEYVSCLDPKYTIQNLLHNKHKVRFLTLLDKRIAKRPISSCYNIYVTVDKDISYIDVPTGLHIDPIKIGTNKTDFLLVRPYHYDECFKKDEKTVVSLFVDQNQDDYAYFMSLSEKKYKSECERINSSVIDAFIKRYPELEGKVELLSFFGPKELNKRTNSSYGAIQSYSFTDKGLFYIYSGNILTLSNLRLCSQWNRSIGGTPTALLTAINMAKKI